MELSKPTVRSDVLELARTWYQGRPEKLSRSECYSDAWPPADSMVSRERQEGGFGPTIRTEGWQQLATEWNTIEPVHSRLEPFGLENLDS